jgi:hydroxyethylthiazole kinase-like uncharacterized protein yjeF
MLMIWKVPPKMIVDHEQMKAIERASGLSSAKLMDAAGAAVAAEIMHATEPGANILFLIGKGNNGGDGLVAAALLEDRKVKVFLADGKPATKEAETALRRIPSGAAITERSLHAALTKADLIVDAVYGFSYHGSLEPSMKKLFSAVNDLHRRVFSIDINSGCECDTGYCENDALRSDVTLALDCWKPFHMMRKNHQMFHEAKLLSLELPHPEHSRFHEMNEDLFFRSFPKKEESAYKGTFGKTSVIGGCWGMAGAMCLNITGAQTIGTSYLQAVLPEDIYPIVAGRFISPVFHPFGHETWHQVISDVLGDSRSISFGSGAVYMDHKEDILDLILQESHCPVVLDAEALRLLKHNTYVLRFVKSPVIVTPHLSEFAGLINQPVEVIQDNRLTLALKFAKEYGVIVVLKSPNTIVVSPSGEVYINQTGSQALAQAGSGDILTGMMTALLSMTRDVFQAVCMAVWLHGYLADLGTRTHSIQGFRLDRYPEIMDELFARHGF